MSNGRSAQEMSRGDFAVLLGLLTVAHTVGTVSIFTLPAVAPAAAAAYGVPVYTIGYQASLMSMGIIIALVLGGNLSLRWGATRVNQVGLVLVAVCAIVLTVPSVATLVPASIGLGMGYGALTPSASHILVRFTPANRRNVVFSLKQSGVPLGGVIAALAMPPIAVAAGWEWALRLDAVLALCVAVLLERYRRRWDDDRRPETPLASSPFGAVGMIWSRPRLRLMGFAGGCLVASQVCIQNYTVAMFYEEFSFSLVAAGIVLTVSQAGGVAGRLFWGWLADRRRDCMLVLGWLATTLVVASLASATLALGWPMTLVLALFAVMGATASGWNGAFLGEVARVAPAGQVSTATGGALFFVNVSSVTAPVLFALAFSAIGRYSVTFGLLTLTSVAAVLCLRSARRIAPDEQPTARA